MTHWRTPAERSLRLRGFDYRAAETYFVTLVAWHRECLFGRAVGSGIELSSLGRLVQERWFAIPEHVPGLQLGSVMVMPNHLHGLLTLPEVDLSAPGIVLRGFPRHSLAGVIGDFKASVTRVAGMKAGTVWQSRFYDTIVRSQHHLESLEEYIALNPERWRRDPQNRWSNVPERERDGASVLWTPRGDDEG